MIPAQQSSYFYSSLLTPHLPASSEYLGGFGSQLLSKITRPESYRMGSLWWLNLLRDSIASYRPRGDDNPLEAEPCPRPWGGSTGAFPKPLQNLAVRTAVEGTCPPHDQVPTWDISDISPKVLKNCEFLVYDKHAWKKGNSHLPFMQWCFTQTKRANAQPLIYEALIYATNINEVQAKGTPLRPPCI